MKSSEPLDERDFISNAGTTNAWAWTHIAHVSVLIETGERDII